MQTDKRIDSSLLAKPPAIAVWLAACILAALFEKTALGFFTGFVFLLTLSSWLWARASLKAVDFGLAVDSVGMFPGQSFTVTRTVRNRKALPMLWAEIREPCAPGECAAPAADVVVEEEVFIDAEKGSEKTYERLYAISLIRWRQSVCFRDEWTAKRRGILEIGASLLRSGDGFGLGVESKRFVFPAPGRIVVYPRLASVSVSGILDDMWDTRSGTDGYLKDRTVIKSVRDYLPGDAAHDVNMRLLAHGLALKTNVFETVTPDSVLFVLDAGSFRGSSPDSFEHALSVLAALIDGLAKRGIQTALMAPASKWFPAACTPPSSLEGDRHRMFELLAAASQDDEGFSAEGPFPADEPGRVYIVCPEAGRATAQFAPAYFPEHKTVFLEAEGTGAGIHGRRVRSLFGFETAGGLPGPGATA